MVNGKMLSGALTIILICAGTVFMAVLIVSKLNIDESSYQFIQDLGFNWSQGPINDISTSNIACPSGSTGFINDKWPGTVAGCNCGVLGITRGYCDRSRNSYQEYCLDISPIPAMNYVFYDGLAICRKNATISYLDLTVATGSCPSSAPKSCGIIDSLENLYCVGATDSCPINEIMFIAKNTTVPSGFTSIPLSTRSLIYSNSTTLGKIPIQTKISDDTPCINPAEQNYYLGQTYILDFYYPKGNCTTQIIDTYFNQAYKKLDTYYYYDLLFQNKISTFLLSILPTYPSSRLNHDTNLYVKNYIGLKPECKVKLLGVIQNDINGFNNNLQIVGQTAVDAVNLAQTTFALAIATFILIILWGGFNIGCKCFCWEGTRSGRACSYLIVYAVIVAALIIVTMGFAAAFSDKINSIGNAHTLLGGCMDNYSEAMLSKFVVNVAIVQKLTIVGAVLCAFALIIVVVELLTWRCTVNRSSNDDDDNDYYNANAHADNRVDIKQHDGPVLTVGISGGVNHQNDMKVEVSEKPNHGKVSVGVGLTGGNTATMGGNVELGRVSSAYETPENYDKHHLELPPPNLAQTPSIGVSGGVGVSGGTGVGVSGGTGLGVGVSGGNVVVGLSGATAIGATGSLGPSGGSGIGVSNINPGVDINIGVNNLDQNVKSNFNANADFAGMEEDDEDYDDAKVDAMVNDFLNDDVNFKADVDVDVNVDVNANKDQL